MRAKAVHAHWDGVVQIYSVVVASAACTGIQGRILGGSGSINGMLYLRGHSLEYDRWAQLGCHGWERGPILPSCRLLSLGLLAFLATSAIALAQTAPSQPSSPEMGEMMQKHHRLGMMPMTCRHTFTSTPERVSVFRLTWVIGAQKSAAGTPWGTAASRA
jgi:GMC oxidoreductase